MKTRIFIITSALLMPIIPIAAQAGQNMEGLAECESGNTNADTGNGYHGYYQFDDETWASTGRSGSASDHSKAEQTAAARDLYDMRGSQPWPTCGRHISGGTPRAEHFVEEPVPTTRVPATTQRPIPVDVAPPEPRTLALTG